MLSESISEAISIQGIDRNQRLPRKKPNEKSRPLIVKSVYYNTRILISKNKKSLKGQELLWEKNLRPKEWKYYKKQEKNIHLKTFRHKIEGLGIGIKWVTELNYIIIKMYSHGTLRCLKRKVKIVLVFAFLFSFCLCCLFLGIRCTYFIFLCLSRGKTPLIKIIFVKVLLMLIC